MKDINSAASHFYLAYTKKLWLLFSLIFFLPLCGFAEDVPANDTISTEITADTSAADTLSKDTAGKYIAPDSALQETDFETEDHASHDDALKIGERLFYGLLVVNDTIPSCASCHNVNYIDTLNWSPSAYDVALKYADKDAEALMQVINNPIGNLANWHAGYDLDEEDVARLKLFLQEVEKDGQPEPKPVISELLLFILAFVLVTGAIGDLIFVKLVRFKILHMVVILAGSLYMLKVVAHEAIALGRQEGYEPTQPIKFSHQVHAQENNIDCQYCHNTAEFSKSAGIPSNNVCMNCHIIVRDGANSGRFEIDKIWESNDSMKRIEWIKIHNLPDHVFFSHAQHVAIGKVDCATCHGEIESMHRVSQVEDLSMGWCINCHRETEVQFFENDFYKKYEELQAQVESGELDIVTAAEVGGTNCMMCHY